MKIWEPQVPFGDSRAGSSVKAILWLLLLPPGVSRLCLLSSSVAHSALVPPWEDSDAGWEEGEVWYPQEERGGFYCLIWMELVLEEESHTSVLGPSFLHGMGCGNFPWGPG